MPETPTQRLAALLIGEPLSQFAATRRTSGASWRKVAADLRVATNGQVDITGEALRGWYGTKASA